MCAIGPKNPLVKLNESDLTESANCVHSWHGVGVTRSGCDGVKSWYGVDVTACIHGTEFQCTLCSVHSTLVIHLADFLKHNFKKSAKFHT